MRKLLGILLIGLIVFSVHAWAESVTTSDGINFNVTNDVGVSSVYTNAQIEQQIQQSNYISTRDQQKLLADSEIAYSWQGVEMLAQNAEAQFNQTISVNGT
jgi:hypothetical protein